jgi:glycosyltransferase involved in cell wall biosynthesis
MKISVIIPCYNDELSIMLLLEKMQLVENNTIFEGVEFEYVFVDDGSTDNTYKNQLLIKEKYLNKVSIVKLTRNFGSYNSFLAGMYYATGDCNVYLHADLQDPPELIPQLYENHLKGFPLVIANRNDREDSSLFSLMYHYMVKKYVIKNIPSGGFDLILFSREIKQHILDISEKK